MNAKLKPGSLCKIKDTHDHYYSQLYGNRIVILLRFFKGIGDKGCKDYTINVPRRNDTWLFYSIERKTFAQLIPNCFEIFEIENKEEIINEK